MIRHAACVLIAAIALAGCASTQQDDGRPISDAEGRTAAVSPATTGVEMCELVGRDSIVKVLATQAGTRYTLCTLAGAPLAKNLDAAGLARLRPDLDPASMQADWGKGELMLMDLAD